MKAPAVVTVLVAVALTLITVAQADATEFAYVIRTLAENVLGTGTVKAVSATRDGSQVRLRWESATFRPRNIVAASRELLYAEAELALGSVVGRLSSVTRIRFSIMYQGLMLATGEYTRESGIALIFGTTLGGGTYVKGESAVGAARSGGTRAPKD